MLFLGPHRTCAPIPIKAGCAEMADIGTRSSVGAAIMPVAVGAKAVGRERAAGEMVRVGRRVGREVNVLLLC